MEEDIEPTIEDFKREPLLQLFRYKHLTHDKLRQVARGYTAQALLLVEVLPRNPERTVALRKLRESKDAACTAILWIEAPRDATPTGPR
jgi:hypothetical protein